MESDKDTLIAQLKSQAFGLEKINSDYSFKLSALEKELEEDLKMEIFLNEKITKLEAQNARLLKAYEKLKSLFSNKYEKNPGRSDAANYEMARMNVIESFEEALHHSGDEGKV